MGNVACAPCDGSPCTACPGSTSIFGPAAADGWAVDALKTLETLASRAETERSGKKKHKGNSNSWRVWKKSPAGGWVKVKLLTRDDHRFDPPEYFGLIDEAAAGLEEARNQHRIAVDTYESERRIKGSETDREVIKQKKRRDAAESNLTNGLRALEDIERRFDKDFLGELMSFMRHEVQMDSKASPQFELLVLRYKAKPLSQEKNPKKSAGRWKLTFEITNPILSCVRAILLSDYTKELYPFKGAHHHGPVLIGIEFRLISHHFTTDRAVDSMAPAALQKVLQEHSVKYGDCETKEDFVKRLRDALQDDIFRNPMLRWECSLWLEDQSSQTPRKELVHRSEIENRLQRLVAGQGTRKERFYYEDYGCGIRMIIAKGAHLPSRAMPHSNPGTSKLQFKLTSVQALAVAKEKEFAKMAKFIREEASDRQIVLDQMYQKAERQYLHRTGVSVCRCRDRRHLKGDAECNTAKRSVEQDKIRFGRIFERLMQIEVFDKDDNLKTDPSPFVDSLECVSRLSRYMPNKPISFWKLLARSLDTAGSGKVSFDAFRRGLIFWLTAEDRSKVRAMFYNFDMNGNHLLSHNEIVDMITELIEAAWIEDSTTKEKDDAQAEFGSAFNLVHLGFSCARYACHACTPCMLVVPCASRGCCCAGYEHHVPCIVHPVAFIMCTVCTVHMCTVQVRIVQVYMHTAHMRCGHFAYAGNHAHIHAHALS